MMDKTKQTRNTVQFVTNGEENKKRVVDKERKDDNDELQKDDMDKDNVKNDEVQKEDEDGSDEGEELDYEITRKQRRTLKLNDETIEAIKDVFRDLDKDNSGTLDASELSTAMKSMGVDCGDKEIEELMKNIDGDGNGTIELFEFAQMVSSKLSEYDPEKELKEAFAVFDMNGDGRITVDELRTVAESLGGAMTEAELESMLREADDNNDGYLDYAEFVRIWMGEDAYVTKTKDDEKESDGDTQHGQLGST